MEDSDEDEFQQQKDFDQKGFQDNKDDKLMFDEELD